MSSALARAKVFHFNFLAEEISFLKTYSTISSSFHSQGRWWARASGKVLRSRSTLLDTCSQNFQPYRCIFSIFPHLYSLLASPLPSPSFLSPRLCVIYPSPPDRIHLANPPRNFQPLSPDPFAGNRGIGTLGHLQLFAYRAKFARPESRIRVCLTFRQSSQLLLDPPCLARRRTIGKFAVSHDLSGASPGSTKTTRTTSTYSVSLFPPMGVRLAERINMKNKLRNGRPNFYGNSSFATCSFCRDEFQQIDARRGISGRGAIRG